MHRNDTHDVVIWSFQCGRGLKFSKLGCAQSWSLFLNKGSSVTLSYQLDTDGLFLVVLQGEPRPAGITIPPHACSL